MSELLEGYATATGTAVYAARHVPVLDPAHYRRGEGLSLSSIGLGTYLGSDDVQSDDLYVTAVRRALGLGCNVIDSAINYRSQRSERAVGRSLALAIADGIARREEVLLCSKGGYIPFEGARPENYRSFVEDNYFRTGILKPEEVVADCHALAPRYLDDQLARSRRNLGVSTLDVYYLHNPETQLVATTRSEFLKRMRAAFAALERAACDGRIARYGTATWNGYRQVSDHREALDLEELLALARDVGGADHHFRVVQLPINLVMREAHELANQRSSHGGASKLVPLLDVAREHGVLVMASAPVMQGRLTRNLPQRLRQELSGLRSDAQRAIQLVRSLPGVTCALVGMKQVAHVEENLGVARVPPLAAGDVAALLAEEE